MHRAISGNASWVGDACVTGLSEPRSERPFVSSGGLKLPNYDSIQTTEGSIETQELDTLHEPYEQSDGCRLVLRGDGTRHFTTGVSELARATPGIENSRGTSAPNIISPELHKSFWSSVGVTTNAAPTSVVPPANATLTRNSDVHPSGGRGRQTMHQLQPATGVHTVPGGPHVSNSKHLVEPLLAAAARTFGEGLSMQLNDVSGQFSISFDNQVLKPRIGKHLTCAWRAAIRCATQSERPLSDHSVNRRSRAIEFVGTNLLQSIGGDTMLYNQIQAARRAVQIENPQKSRLAPLCAPSGAIAERSSASASQSLSRSRGGSTDSMLSTVALQPTSLSVQSLPASSPAASSFVGQTSSSSVTAPSAQTPETQYLVPQYLSQPLLHGLRGTYGDGLLLTLGSSPRDPWSIRFDNRMLNPSIGFIKSGGWRAAVRRVADSEKAVVKNGASVRVVEFSGNSLFKAVRGCRALLCDLGFGNLGSQVQRAQLQPSSSAASGVATAYMNPPSTAEWTHVWPGQGQPLQPPQHASLGGKRSRDMTPGSTGSTNCSSGVLRGVRTGQGSSDDLKRPRHSEATIGGHGAGLVASGDITMAAISGLQALASASEAMAGTGHVQSSNSLGPQYPGGSAGAIGPGAHVPGALAAGPTGVHVPQLHAAYASAGAGAGAGSPMHLAPGSHSYLDFESLRSAGRATTGTSSHERPSAGMFHSPLQQQHHYMQQLPEQMPYVLSHDGGSGAVPLRVQRAHIEAQMHIQQLQMAERQRQLEQLEQLQQLRRMQEIVQRQREEAQAYHWQRMQWQHAGLPPTSVGHFSPHSQQLQLTMPSSMLSQGPTPEAVNSRTSTLASAPTGMASNSIEALQRSSRGALPPCKSGAQLLM